MTITPDPAHDLRSTGDDLVHGRASVAGGPGDRLRSVRPARRRSRDARLLAAIFLGPALLMLLVLVCYPIVYTVWLSFRSGDGTRFVGWDNYVTMFTSPSTRRAILNNMIWVVVAPSVVTVLGLIFAVLTERLRRSAALKAILFMPMAISFLAAGVTFRLVYDEDPNRGALNAAAVTVHDIFTDPSLYHGMDVRDNGNLVPVAPGFEASEPVSSGQVIQLPLVGLPPDRIPTDAVPASPPPAGPGLAGVVWLDFTRGGGGTAGVIDPAEVGLPQMTVEAVTAGGEVVATTSTDAAGRFAFPELTDGPYVIRLPTSNFAEPFNGVTWLGPSLITPAVIGAYIWIWAGFAMVLVSAGLAALPREALEAARVDGASGWQTFRHVTVPLVRPVLVVVLVTLTINVLKIFDLVYVLAPESSQSHATVVALEMYRVSFGGGLDYGLGSALAVLLFALVLPAMLFNIRRLKGER
ncbi:ABC transporter permease [Micromonospora craniellae]|uniref:ABC transporter permease subunit n=1 Tax=Micromonospora craniellae TaxID=2294034 RepID=A0A372FXZ9_9ACTN|nr:ABC transporter permease subunit [Micromonospora craniellae]RFS45578.1 ABC transporter permease subunit [Micromonospora craniellae]